MGCKVLLHPELLARTVPAHYLSVNTPNGLCISAWLKPGKYASLME